MPYSTKGCKYVLVRTSHDRRRRYSFVVVAFSVSLAVNPARTETYLAGYIGGARTRATTVLVEQHDPIVRLSIDNVPFGGRSFQSPIYYGYRAGYYLTRHVGLEAEFIHMKIYADLNQAVSIQGTLAGVPVRERAPLSRYADQFEVSHGLNMVLVNAVLRRALVGGSEPEETAIALVVRAGAGPTVPRPEVIIFGAASGAYEAGPAAVQVSAGVEARLWRGLHVLTDYKYTFTPTTFTIPNGRASLNVHSHHLVTGLGIRF